MRRPSCRATCVTCPVHSATAGGSEREAVVSLAPLCGSFPVNYLLQTCELPAAGVHATLGGTR